TDRFKDPDVRPFTSMACNIALRRTLSSKRIGFCWARCLMRSWNRLDKRPDTYWCSMPASDSSSFRWGVLLKRGTRFNPDNLESARVVKMPHSMEYRTSGSSRDRLKPHFAEPT